MRVLITQALIGLALLTTAASAQGRRAMPRPGPGAIIERLNRMTPEQRQRALDRLPPERRAKVQERLDRWNALPPNTRERLHDQYEEFQKLAPEKQQAVRQAFRNLNDLPRERRLTVRRELLRLRNMSTEERSAYVAAPHFQSRYNEAERQIIRDLADVAPPVAPSIDAEK